MLLRLIHHLFITLIICTLSLFEVSDSLRLRSAMAGNSADDLTPTSGKLFKGDTQQTLTGNEEDAAEINTGSSFAMGAESVLSFIFMVLAALVSVAGLHSCFGNVRMGIGGAACAWSSGLMGAGALAYLVGEVYNYVSAHKATVGKIAYSEESLEKYGAFCQLYNQLEDDERKNIEDWPSHVRDAIPNEENFKKEYKIYCNQVDTLLYQKESLDKIAKSLEVKVWLNGASAAAFASASLYEILWINREIKEKIDLTSAYETATTECTTAAATSGAGAISKVCIEPLLNCVAELQKFMGWYQAMASAEEASKWTPKSSNSLFCTKAFLSSELADQTGWRLPCYIAIAGCEEISKTTGEPAGAAAAAICMKGLLPFSLVREGEKGNQKCSIDSSIANYVDQASQIQNVEGLKGQQQQIQSNIKGMEGDTFPEGIDPETLASAGGEDLTKAIKILRNTPTTTATTQMLGELTKLTEVSDQLGKLTKSMSIKTLTEAENAMSEKMKGARIAADACNIACNDKALFIPKSPGAYNDQPFDQHIFDENFNLDQEKFNAEMEKAMKYAFIGKDVFNSIFGVSDANANNTSVKTEAGLEDFTFRGAIALMLGLGTLALFGVFSGVAWISKWFYKDAPMRSIWNGALALVAGVNAWAAHVAQKDLEKDVKRLNKIVKDFKLIGSIDVAATAAETTTFQQQVNSSFEDNAKADYSKYDVPKTPCLNGGNGKGGCRGVGQSLKASLKSLGDLGQTGVSNDIMKLADSLNGTENISGALNSAQNLSNAVGKLKGLKRRLIKKYNANRQKMGLKPVDIEKRERSLAKGLVNSLRAFNNPELQAKLNGEVLASAKPTLDENEKDLLEKLKAKKKGGVEEAKKEEDFMSGLNFNFQKEKEEGMADFDMDDDSGDRVEDLDIQVNDISKRENDSIFRAISTRYFKSAYPVLLEEVSQ